MLSKTPSELREIINSGLNYGWDIIDAISKCLGYSREDIEGHTRRQEVVKARDLIAFLLREYGNISYSEIGRLLGNRDHTTILHAYKKIKQRIKIHPELKIKLENLIQEAELIGVEKNCLTLKNAGPVKIKRIYMVFRDIPSRNLKILELWREGLTLRKISSIVGVTNERIRQIVITTIRQMTINESISRGITIDIDTIIEEEFKKRKTLQENNKEKILPIKKKKRWSRYYVACRLCGTTAIPHLKHGLCEECSGRYRGERRKDIIAKHFNVCEKCKISHGDALRKYGRDFYVTKSRQVLCRGCFLEITGKKLGHSRVRRVNI